MADNSPVVLVIEDERPLQKFLRVTLESQSYAVIEATRGEEGLRHAAMSRPDLVILDLGLPDLDGVEVTRRLCEWSAVPIIVVSARGKEQDKVVALDAGADDYLTKPFGVAELLARVRVSLRHLAAANSETGEAVYQVGELRLDPILKSGKKLALPAQKKSRPVPRIGGSSDGLVKTAIGGLLRLGRRRGGGGLAALAFGALLGRVHRHLLRLRGAHVLVLILV